MVKVKSTASAGGKSTFRLPSDVQKKLRETAKRLEMPQAKIVAVLVRKYAEALQVRVE